MPSKERGARRHVRSSPVAQDAKKVLDTPSLSVPRVRVLAYFFLVVFCAFIERRHVEM